MHPTPETRAVEQSVADASGELAVAERILSELFSQVTGYSPPEATGTEQLRQGGLVNDADNLASRMTAFVDFLERTRTRIVSPNVSSMRQGSAGGMNSAAAYG